MNYVIGLGVVAVFAAVLFDARRRRPRSTAPDVLAVCTNIAGSDLHELAVYHLPPGGAVWKWQCGWTRYTAGDLRRTQQVLDVAGVNWCSRPNLVPDDTGELPEEVSVEAMNAGLDWRGWLNGRWQRTPAALAASAAHRRG